MNYTLPDGREINLDTVTDISAIKDQGIDSRYIDKSILSFTIYVRSGQSIQVTEYYHYADWAEAKKRLNKIRADLLAALEQNTSSDT